MTNKFLLYIVLLLTVSPVFAKTNLIKMKEIKTEIKTNVLTLDVFVKKTIRNNSYIKAIKKDYISKRWSNKRIKAINDLFVTASIGYTWADPLLNNGIDMGLKNYNNYDFKVSLSKKFPALLGMNAQLKLGYSSLKYDPAVSTTLKDNQPSIGLMLNIPLLSNFLGKIDRNKLKGMSIMTDLLIKMEKEAVEKFILQIHKVYLNWRLATQKLDVYHGFLQRSRNLYFQTLRKRKVGFAGWADVHLTRQNYLRYQTLMINTKLEVEQLYLKIMEYMEGKVNIQSSEISKKGIRWIPSKKISHKFWFDKKTVTENNLRILQIRKLQLYNERLSYSSAKSDMKPDLRFLLSVSKTGEGDSFKNSFDKFSRGELYTGFELNFSLQNNDKKNEFKAKNSNVDKAEKEYSDAKVQVAYALKTMDSSINSLSKMLKVTKTSVKVSLYRVGAMYKQYLQGRTFLAQVTDARDTYSNMFISLFEQKAALDKLFLDYAEFTDNLFSRYKEYFTK